MAVIRIIGGNVGDVTVDGDGIIIQGAGRPYEDSPLPQGGGRVYIDNGQWVSHADEDLADATQRELNAAEDRGRAQVEIANRDADQFSEWEV